MTRTDEIYEAIMEGNNTYQLLSIRLPHLTSSQFIQSISSLVTRDFIIKTGHSKNSIFAINPNKQYKTYKPINTLSNGIELKPDNNEIKHVQSSSIMNFYFNQLFQNLVKQLGEEIAAKAKEHAYAILNTPELANELGKSIMGKFNMPVIVFNGPDATTVTFKESVQHREHKSIKSNVPEIPVTPEVKAPIFQLDDTYSNMQAPIESKETVKKIRLPKICVTGMKPIEAGSITTEFGNTFDIVFWNDRDGNSVSQLKSYSESCKAIFWHVRHCSHADEKVASGGTAEFYRVNGDLSQMKRKLKEYYDKLSNIKI